MVGILSCPPEVTINILISCPGFSDVVSLIGTCRQLHSVWLSNSQTIIWALAQTCIPAFDHALMAARAINVVKPAFELGELVPQVGPIQDLSGHCHKPTRFRRGVYRLLLAGAVLSRAYNEPFFVHREQTTRYLSEGQVAGLRGRGWDFLRQSAVYVNEPNGEKESLVFEPLSSWIVNCAKTEAGKRHFVPCWKRTGSFEDGADQEDVEEEDDQDTQKTSSLPLGDSDIFAIWELMTMLLSYELTHIRFANGPNTNPSTFMRLVSKPLPSAPIRSVFVVFFGIFQLEEVFMPTRVEETTGTLLVTRRVSPVVTQPQQKVESAGDNSQSSFRPYSWDIPAQLWSIPLPPGFSSRQVTAGQPETWSAKQAPAGRTDYLYNVRDYGALRPKLVYNCRLVPALCKNAGNYLGGGTTSQFHYDAFRTKRGADGNKKTTRVDARRDQACPSNWINGDRCPEDDQTDWTWQSPVGVALEIRPFVKAELYKYKDGTTHKNRLAKVVEVDVPDEDNPLITHKEYHSTPYGAVFSCDEFPAASWIEGGSGARTYCNQCNEVDLVSEILPATFTEQNWQGLGHDALQQWFKHLSGSKWSPLSAKRDFTIFKFDFEMRTEAATVGDAVWVEVRGTKRYCYGPLRTTGNNCAETRADDPAPNNDDLS
ncbi:hypothetical protein GQ53DRAFT_854268 [Thozetella sp. PMI_491]|nr:hypothetical protein GQ53DRAFT_854268 [Thozetella sp. PMI_491]